MCLSVKCQKNSSEGQIGAFPRKGNGRETVRKLPIRSITSSPGAWVQAKPHEEMTETILVHIFRVRYASGSSLTGT